MKRPAFNTGFAQAGQKNLDYDQLESHWAFAGCTGAGTHGLIKGYRYIISKDSLQKAVMTVIKKIPIYRNTSLDSPGISSALDHLDDNGGNYSSDDNYYNDIRHYVTITMSFGQIKNEYVLDTVFPHLLKCSPLCATT